VLITSSNLEEFESMKRKSIPWYLKAAEQGHPLAQFNLSIQYSSDNPQEAKKWQKKFIDGAKPASVDFSWGIEWGFLNDDIWIQNSSTEDWNHNELFLEVTLKRKGERTIEYYDILSVPPLATGERYLYEDIMSISSGSDETINKAATLYCLK